MNSIEFLFWLQGFFELSKPACLLESQVEEIDNHIKLVKKENPTISNFVAGIDGALEFFNAAKIDFDIGLSDKESSKFFYTRLTSHLKTLTNLIEVRLKEELNKKTPRMDRPGHVVFNDPPIFTYNPNLIQIQGTGLIQPQGTEIVWQSDGGAKTCENLFLYEGYGNDASIDLSPERPPGSC